MFFSGLELALAGKSIVVVFCFVDGVGCEISFFASEGKDPFPFRSQYKLTSGKTLMTLSTKSKLGLFRPDRRCEMLERCTLTLSAKLEAERL